MRKSVLMLAILVSLSGLTAALITGCGGGGETGTITISGTATTTSATRGPGDVEYVPTADCTIYAINAATGAEVTPRIHTNLDGSYTLMNIPGDVEVEIVAVKNQLHLKARLQIEPGTARGTQDVNPDTTIACSLADQLEQKQCTSEQVWQMYILSLAHQSANRFKYGHCNGTACDMTDPDEIALTARECLEAVVNEQIRLALQSRVQERCALWISTAMCDAALNANSTLKLTALQQTRLATRALDGELWTDAEAADLLAQAGITADGGGAVTEALVTQARARLLARFPALVQPKLCAVEMLMIACQTSDAIILFHAQNQQQLDALINLIAPE